MRRFFWLASYPKSGSTWLRLFLANLREESGHPVGINAINLGALDNDRSMFDGLIGTDSDELTPDQIDRLRPEACRLLARRLPQRLYSKTHDAYRATGGEGFFPLDATQAAIYVVRNPFDLVISCSYFFEKSIDAMIDLMADPDYALSSRTDRYQPLLRQHLGRWSDHVGGWIGVRDFPILVVRYEDMLSASHETFSGIARFAGLAASPERVADAVGRTSFGQLQSQERLAGFRENLSAAHLFFRSGKAGAWRRQLSDGQVDRLIRDHRAVAERLGYLNADGQPSAVTWAEEQAT
jgi:hypothetical protein